MKKIIMGILAISCVVSAMREENAHSQTMGRFLRTLPKFSLKDPVGKTFTEKDFSNGGVVIVISAPILSCEDTQREWNRLLNKERPGRKGRILFVEDMGPSMFRKKALKAMKKEYEPGEEPVLLIDPDGKLRKKFGVGLKETAVLVYDRNGRLVHEECGEPTPQAAHEIWKMVGI